MREDSLKIATYIVQFEGWMDFDSFAKMKPFKAEQLINFADQWSSYDEFFASLNNDSDEDISNF